MRVHSVGGLQPWNAAPTQLQHCAVLHTDARTFALNRTVSTYAAARTRQPSRPAAAAVVVATTAASHWQAHRRCRWRRKLNGSSSGSGRQRQAYRCRCLLDQSALPVSSSAPVADADYQQQRVAMRALAQSPPLQQPLVLRTALPDDYWAIAEVHCGAFYPREPPGMMHMLLRLDRVMSLTMGARTSTKSAKRRFACLVVGQPAAAGAGNSRQRCWQDFYWDFWRALLPGPITAGLGTNVDLEAADIAGVAVIDTLGTFVPQRQMATGGKKFRTKIAYLSNLAVAPHARRCGVAKQLLQQAEQVAAEWGCTAVMLHVDRGNTAADALYTAANYRKLKQPGGWAAKFSSANAGKDTMMKRIVRRTEAMEKAN